jgi:hypothetical protein
MGATSTTSSSNSSYAAACVVGTRLVLLANTTAFSPALTDWVPHSRIQPIETEINRSIGWSPSLDSRPTAVVRVSNGFDPWRKLVGMFAFAQS